MATPPTITKDMFCAYIDILGFKQSATNNLAMADNQLSIFTSWVRDALRKFPTVSAMSLSDSTCLLADRKDGPDFLKAVMSIQRDCFLDGVMTRGGIAFGTVTFDTFDFVLPNYWGRRLLGPAVVEAVGLEGKFTGMRLCVSKEVARQLRKTGRIVAAGMESELRWVDRGRDEEYMEYLANLARRTMAEHPSEVRHYLETMRLIVRSTRNVDVLTSALGHSSKAPLSKSDAFGLWSDCFVRARLLASTHPKAIRFLRQNMVPYHLSNIGSAMKWSPALRRLLLRIAGRYLADSAT